MAERAQRTAEQKEAIAETASKLADGPELNAREGTWTDATGSKGALECFGDQAQKSRKPIEG